MLYRYLNVIIPDKQARFSASPHPPALPGAGRRYNHLSVSSGISFANSINDVFVACNIFDNVYTDGQRGLPFLSKRLLLLKVVGLKLLFIASLEQDIVFLCAHASIARHKSMCFIFLDSLLWFASDPGIANIIFIYFRNVF